MNQGLFEKIKGHDSIKERLFQSLKKQRLPHALLFSGTSGVGKKAMALALAQKLLCDSHSSCGKCYSCLNVEKNESEHVLFISTENLNLKLEDVQSIHSFLALSTDKFKIVIIDSVDKLNSKAANSLLKILEEPPVKSFFFFVSSEASKLPITIRSRLQTIRFNPLPLDIIRSLVSAEDWVIEASQGSLDRLQELQGQKELRQEAIDLWKIIFKKGAKAQTVDFPVILKKRKEALIVCEYWIQLLRDARLMMVGETNRFIHGDQKPVIEKIAQLSPQELDYLIKKSLELGKNLRSNIDCILCFENFVITIQKTIQSWEKCG